VSGSNAGWLTMHQVLEETELTYRQMNDLVSTGKLGARRCGTTTLYDPEDVRRLAESGAGADGEVSPART
jgi:hypothetical protein